jgi:hypothetical protein
MAGRRPRLDEIVTDAAGRESMRGDLIIRALQSGQTNRVACALAGVAEQMFYSWLRRGERQTRGLYRDFLEAVKKAMAVAEVRLVNTVYRCCEGAVFELKHVDARTGQPIIDPLTGQQKVTPKVMPPDGRLAAQILAVRNPQEWGGERQEASLPMVEDEVAPAIVDLFRSAIEALIEHGETPPAGLTIDVTPKPELPAPNGAVPTKMGTSVETVDTVANAVVTADNLGIDLDKGCG